MQIAAAIPLLAATAFVMLATWVFVSDYWGPGIAEGIAALRG
ncbi:MAG: hypothetical protein WDN24_10040 [Sphingomonas sp.]